MHDRNSEGQTPPQGQSPPGNGPDHKQASIEAAAEAAFDRNVPLEPSSAPGASQMGQAAPVDSFATPFDRVLVERSLCNFLRLASRWANRLLGRYAMAATKDPEFAENIIAETALREDEAKDIGAQGAVVAEKYWRVMRFTPEGALALSVGLVGVRYWSALGDLNDQAKKRRAAEAKAKIAHGK